MDCYENGLSMDVIRVNWTRVEELLEKLGITVPSRVINGIRNFKDGAAELLLEKLYQHFTGREISKIKPRHRVDFSDHAYQVCVAAFDR